MLTLEKAILLDEAFERLTKALRDEVRIRNANNKLLDENYRIMYPVIVEWMRYTNAQIIKELDKKYINKSFQKDKAGKIVTKLTDWDKLKKDGITMVKPATLEIFEKGGNQAYKIAGIEGAFDVVNIEAVNKVNKICSELIVEVTKNTKKAINSLIKVGIQDGQSMGKIAKQIRPLVGLTERQALAVVHYREKLVKKFPKYTDAKLNKMSKRYSDKLHRHRADMIARTETARAQNEGTLQGYKRIGYKKVRWSANVNACSRCMALSGHTFTLEEASGMMPLHPDCRCAWIVAREGIKPKEPRAPKFTPAKTVKEAEKFITKELNLRNADFAEMNLDFVNSINKKLVELKKYNFTLNEISVVQKTSLPKGAFFAIDTASGFENTYLTLQINSEYLKSWKTLEQFNRHLIKLNKQNWLIGKNVEDLVAHEIGHVLTFQNRSYSSAKTIEGIFEKSIKLPYISDYGKTESIEGIAEWFCAYTKGIKVPPEVKSLMDRYFRKATL